MLKLIHFDKRKYYRYSLNKIIKKNILFWPVRLCLIFEYLLLILDL